MHVLIITGGDCDKVFARSYLNKLKIDKMIAADRGLEYVRTMEMTPDYIIGDFDSCSNDILCDYPKENIQQVSSVKDDTDTALAMEKAIAIGADQITILGGFGTRFDHVLGTAGLLVLAMRNGIKAQMVNEYNKITALDGETIVSKERQYGDFISLIPIGKALGVTLEGFAYPLSDVDLVFDKTLGISNRIVDDYGSIRVERGVVLMVESRDRPFR